MQLHTFSRYSIYTSIVGNILQSMLLYMLYVTHVTHGDRLEVWNNDYYNEYCRGVDLCGSGGA